MKVKCKNCDNIIDDSEIGDKGGTGKNDVTEMWGDGCVIHADFIGKCPKCFESKSLFNKTEKQYIIGEKELTQLIKDSSQLNALENGGVDNWTWFDEAMENYDEDELVDFSEYEEFIR